MKDFGNVIYRINTKTYVINNNTYAVPSPDDSTVPEEIREEFKDLYKEIVEYAKLHPEKITQENEYETSSEELEREEYFKNRKQANSLISAKVQNVILQTSTFSAAEFSIFAKAKMYEEWQAGRTYEQNFRLAYNGVVYEVVQRVTSIEGQYPGAEGMLAIYRPISIDSSAGEEPDGSKEKPFVFIYGMDVKKDMYYTYEDKLYLSKADMPACVWYPGTAGLWQWELVE